VAKKKHPAEGVWRRHDGEVRLLGFDQPHISVRDWRRKPPLRLRSTKKLDICPLGTGWLAGHAGEAARCSGSGAAAELGAPMPANGSPEQLFG
jgi:hypothetical protein